MIGATGNIGTAVLDELASHPDIDDVVALARRAPGRSWAKTTFESFDMATDDVAQHLEGVDAVVHLSWIFQPTHRPLITWSTNVVGSMRVFDACVASGVRSLVYSSSVGAYSPGRGRVVHEDWPTDSLPTASYGREKAYLERVLDALEARHQEMRIVRLRPAFVFQHASGTQQRRLFAGPFVPASLLKPGRLPVLPFPSGLRFQAVHSRDIARACVLAVLSDVRGAFNLASDPVIDGHVLSHLLGARLVELPPSLVGVGVVAGWKDHLVPAEPALYDLALGLPIMSAQRARDVLGWLPSVTATDALAEALEGMAQGAGSPTAPLRPDSAAGRLHELSTGFGATP